MEDENERLNEDILSCRKYFKFLITGQLHKTKTF